MSTAKVIAFRERQWIDQKTDFRQWSNLCRSYAVPFQLVEEWEEAQVPAGYQVVVLDEVGKQQLSTFEHPEKCVYVFGRTGLNDLPAVIPCDVAVRVDAPHSKSMFGVSVCCAVLYDRGIK